MFENYAVWVNYRQHKLLWYLLANAKLQRGVGNTGAFESLETMIRFLVNHAVWVNYRQHKLLWYLLASAKLQGCVDNTGAFESLETMISFL